MRIGKLSRRLFLLTLVALFPAAIVLFYNLNAIRQAKEQEVHEEAARAGQLALLEMQRIISGAENVLIALSAAPAIQEQNKEGCQAYLSRVGARLPQFSGIAVVDTSGTILCRQTEDGVGTSLADRNYFKKALETNSFYVGEYSIGRVTKLAMLPLALPIREDGGKISGVIVGSLSLDWLGQRLRERDFAKNSALTIADRNGTILAREPEPGKFVGTQISPEYIRLVTAFQPGTIEAFGRDRTRRILGYYPISSSPMGLYVSAGISTEDAYAAIRNASWIGLAVTIISLSLSFVLAWLTSSELIRRPIQRLIGTIENWRAGDESARTGMSETSGEFGIVGKAIDDFLGELVAARQDRVLSEQQREILVGELDHRVKNLLATVQSIARQTFKDNSRSEEAVQVFTQRLVALSEAHALLVKDEWRSALMQDVIRAATQPFDNEDHPQFEIDGDNFPVKAKATLSLSMALHEMCTNAVKYGALKNPDGKIIIRWEIQVHGDPADAELRLIWVERGGPAVIPPDKSGFGSKMIEKVLAYELEAKIDTQFPVSGMICTLIAPLDRIKADTDTPAFGAAAE